MKKSPAKARSIVTQAHKAETIEVIVFTGQFISQTSKVDVNGNQLQRATFETTDPRAAILGAMQKADVLYEVSLRALPNATIGQDTHQQKDAEEVEIR